MAGKSADGKLAIVSTSNAGTPLTTDATPLLTVDVGTRVLHRLPQRPSKLSGAFLGAG